jgi:adenylate cyclase
MKAFSSLKTPLVTALVFIAFTGIAQGPSPSRIAWADSTLEVVLNSHEMDNRTKLDLTDTIFRIYQANRDTCNQVLTRIEQALYLDNMEMADSALAYMYWANDHYSVGCDSAILFFMYSSYTNVFLTLEELDGVDSIANLALKLWNPRRDDKEERFAILINLAISYAMRGEIDASTATFRQVYQEASAVDDQKFMHKALVNLGTIKGMTEDYDSAYYFLNIAALAAHDNSNISGLIPLLMNLANVDMEREHYAHADLLLDSAYALAEKRIDSDMMANVLDNKAYLYEFKGEFKQAYDFLRAYTEMREEFLNEERVRAVADMMEKYQSELKARQIQQLELDNLDAQIENERIRNARNKLLFLGGFVLLIAIGLWGRLRFVRKSRSELQSEKDVSDGLLLNILPASVAEELKAKGHAEAKYFDTATIMFSDFKDFTKTASKMQAAALVEGVNTYFKAFDEITMKYGIEKIKTIGDAYMAAGGIDDTRPSAAKDVVSAAIEIQKFVVEQKAERASAGLTTFDMRVGVHSGPVVAGIVGIKKFQYDLWGDTVNIASRMENNGRPEKVNISEATYQLIMDDPQFIFESRGMLAVKGKGDMQMYFVDLANDGLSKKR